MAPLLKVPPEMIQAIAGYLESDKDFAAFVKTCRQIHDQLLGPGSGIFRLRFLQVYDDALYERVEDYEAAYKKRRPLVRDLTHITSCKTKREMNALEVIKTLIIEARGVELPDGTITGQNIHALVKLAIFSNVILMKNGGPMRGPTPFITDWTSPQLLQIIRLLLFPIALARGADITKFRCFHFPAIQARAYSTLDLNFLAGSRKRPIVNVNRLLAIQYFWGHHMTSFLESDLFPAYQELPNHDKLQTWTGGLAENNEEFGRYWKGSHSSLTAAQLIKLSTRTNDDIIIQDDIECQIETLNIQPPRSYTATYRDPFTFSNSQFSGIKLHPPSPLKRNQSPAPFHSFRATGTEGTHADGTPRFFAADGRLYDIPPQCGVEGWKHFFMVLRYDDASSQYPQDPQGPQGWHTYTRAYDGIVLPGGRVVLGRWFNIGDSAQTETGPFVWWRVKTNAGDGCVDLWGRVGERERRKAEGLEGFKLWE